MAARPFLYSTMLDRLFFDTRKIHEIKESKEAIESYYS